MAGSKPWSDEENDIVVHAYLDLLLSELQGAPLVKAEVNRRVQADTGRGRSSVEFKFQNISAVMREMGMVFVEGYKPAVNFQNSLSSAVERALGDDLGGLVTVAAATAIQETAPPPTTAVDFVWHDQQQAPRIERSERYERHRRAMRIDFVGLEEANRSLGLAGELAVLERERRMLRDSGCHKLADCVKHVSVEQGDGLGYDILSFDPSGRERFIEVKSTRRGIHWPMLISSNEVEFSKEFREHFELHRVHSYRPTQAGLYVLRGNLEQNCDLRPTVFSALPR